MVDTLEIFRIVEDDPHSKMTPSSIQIEESSKEGEIILIFDRPNIISQEYNLSHIMARELILRMVTIMDGK